MKDSKSFVDPKPLSEALKYASRALGDEGWELMKNGTRHRTLRMRGIADGVTTDFEPHWFDFVGKWGTGVPSPDLDLPNVSLVGPGTSSDLPSGDMLYFHRPTQKQLSSGVLVPVCVIEIVVEMAELRRLIHDRKSSGATRRAVGRPSARKTSVEIFKQRRQAGVPLPKKQIDEAKAIKDDWTGGAPPKPKTISGHISKVWRAAAESSDKPLIAVEFIGVLAAEKSIHVRSRTLSAVAEAPGEKDNVHS
jgi:hypothetical protein